MNLLCTRAELDRWAYLNNGGPMKTLAVNKYTLYAVTSSQNLHVLQGNGVFTQFDSNVFDVDVNDDLGVFVTRPDRTLNIREGVSSSNWVGTHWTHIPGSTVRVATGRRGILIVFDAYMVLYARVGITASSVTGSQWTTTNGGGAARIACSKRACLVVNQVNYVYSTGLLQGSDSPPISQWIWVTSGVKDLSAYGEHSLWMIDKNDVVWKGVHVQQSFTHFSWVRQSYNMTFKDIAITDDIQFGIGSDDHVMVLTGCPIFDFEDNDLSNWEQTGVAFLKQPVIGQEYAYGRRTGKVGTWFIDTYSSRTSEEMKEDDPNATQTDWVTGALKSPSFQINTNILHFIVGGGSPPYNFIALFVDDVEVMRSSGQSSDKVGPNGAVRSSRNWWNVAQYKGKCAYVKIIDAGTGYFGHTIFDDLRASPPCFKNMKVRLENFNHDGNVSMGQSVEYKLRVEGFYSSKTRPLVLNISYPLKDKTPFLYIKSFHFSSAVCKESPARSRKYFSEPKSSSRHYTSSLNITNYLLSKATFTIKLKVYDHHVLKIGEAKSVNGLVKVKFSDEYFVIFAHEVKIRKHGNETAKVYVNERIVNPVDEYFVNDTFKYHVQLSHDLEASLQRARNVMIKLMIPPYISLLKVNGLRGELGDQIFSPAPSKQVVYIPELLLDDVRTIEFSLRIDGQLLWGRKYGAKMQAQFLVDEISYCEMEGCKSYNSNATNITFLVKNKVYELSFSYKKEEKRSTLEFTKLATSSFVVICGPYDPDNTGRCYYGNSSTWQRLATILSNVDFYDEAKKEIFGTSWTKHKIKLYDDAFRYSVYLSDEQWEAAKHSNVIASSKVSTSSGMKEFSKEVSDKGTLWNKWHCCK